MPQEIQEEADAKAYMDELQKIVDALSKQLSEFDAQAKKALQALAAAKEVESAEYRQKIEYLERQLSDIQTKARKQDEKLEKLSVNSGRARVDVERAKRTRAIDTDATELCRKLAELGHPCE